MLAETATSVQPTCVRADVCGNGILDRGEECDDGNLDDADDCLSSCTRNACGDGEVRLGAEGCDDGNRTDGDGCDRNCTRTACGNGVVTAGELCDDGNAMNLDGCKTDCTANLLADVEASNPDAFDEFGNSIALSADGSTLAVGAHREASAAMGIGGDQADNSAWSAGAVYVFTRSGATWNQQAYLKASNTDVWDEFGYSVALSADGSTLAVGAPGEASAATGSDADQADNSADFAGAVYVFTRSGTAWTQQAYLKASNTRELDYFGYSVALSADGSTLAVGARDASAGEIIGGSQSDSFILSGAVYVFTRSSATWTQQAYLKASNPDKHDQFGYRVALSGDGSTLAVGANMEFSAATGIDGDQADNSTFRAGAVYVFARSGATWRQQTYLKASNTGALDEFGSSVALSGDGSTLAVGAPGEAGAATGIDGIQISNSAEDAGAVYVFTRSGTTWSLQAYLKASNTDRGDHFGVSVALSGDGSTLAVGAPDEASAATGAGGDQVDNATASAGAVYVFTQSGRTWNQPAYLKASTTNRGDHFGFSVALSGDGLALAVGAPGGSSIATGPDDDPANNAAPSAGAAYVVY